MGHHQQELNRFTADMFEQQLRTISDQFDMHTMMQHKVVVLSVVHESVFYLRAYASELECSVISCISEGLFQLCQATDHSSENVMAIVNGKFESRLHQNIIARLESLNTGSVDELCEFLTDACSNIFSDHGPMITKSLASRNSIVGQFVRLQKCWYESASFTTLIRLSQSLKSYLCFLNLESEPTVHKSSSSDAEMQMNIYEIHSKTLQILKDIETSSYMVGQDMTRVATIRKLSARVRRRYPTFSAVCFLDFAAAVLSGDFCAANDAIHKYFDCGFGYLNARGFGDAASSTNQMCARASLVMTRLCRLFNFSEHSFHFLNECIMLCEKAGDSEILQYAVSEKIGLMSENETELGNAKRFTRFCIDAQQNDVNFTSSGLTSNLTLLAKLQLIQMRIKTGDDLENISSDLNEVLAYTGSNNDSEERTKHDCCLEMVHLHSLLTLSSWSLQLGLCEDASLYAQSVLMYENVKNYRSVYCAAVANQTFVLAQKAKYEEAFGLIIRHNLELSESKSTEICSREFLLVKNLLTFDLAKLRADWQLCEKCVAVISTVDLHESKLRKMELQFCRGEGNVAETAESAPTLFVLRQKLLHTKMLLSAKCFGHAKKFLEDVQLQSRKFHANLILYDAMLLDARYQLLIEDFDQSSKILQSKELIHACLSNSYLSMKRKYLFAEMFLAKASQAEDPKSLYQRSISMLCEIDKICVELNLVTIGKVVLMLIAVAANEIGDLEIRNKFAHKFKLLDETHDSNNNGRSCELFMLW